MTERNGMRYGLLGLIVLSLLIALGLIVATQSSPTSEPAAPSATAAPVLESLAALDGRAPARREPVKNGVAFPPRDVDYPVQR